MDSSLLCAHNIHDSMKDKVKHGLYVCPAEMKIYYDYFKCITESLFNATTELNHVYQKYEIWTKEDAKIKGCFLSDTTWVRKGSKTAGMTYSIKYVNELISRIEIQKNIVKEVLLVLDVLIDKDNYLEK